MAENNHNDQILNMLALNEEINSLNNKVKQLVEDLHNTQTVLGGIQDLTSTLTTKVSQFTSTIGTYKPRVEEPEEKPKEIIELAEQKEPVNKGLILWWIIVIVLIFIILILTLIMIRLIRGEEEDLDYNQPKLKPIIQQSATEEELWQP